MLKKITTTFLHTYNTYQIDLDKEIEESLILFYDAIWSTPDIHESLLLCAGIVILVLL